MLRTTHALMALVAVAAALLISPTAIAAPTVPFDTSDECFECHDPEAGGPSSTVADFSAASVDYFSCSACHWIGPTDLIGDRWRHNHFQIDPRSSCADCHNDPDYPEAVAYYTPDVLTIFGYFDEADSLSTSPEDLHKIHVNGSWPRFANFFPYYCRSCHEPAACGACHGDSLPHSDHTYDEDTASYVYPPVSYAQALGTTPGDPNQLNYPVRSSTCAAAECHPPSSATTVLQVPSCTSCHPATAQTHSASTHDSVARGDVPSGCEGCHFGLLDMEHAALGLSCGVCHQSSDLVIAGAISGGDTDCLTCHPDSAHNLAQQQEFDPDNGSLHRIDPTLPGMRDSFTYGSKTFMWTRPTVTSFLRAGLDYDTMVDCDSCHSYSGAIGPHGATMQVNIDPAYPVDWTSGYLGSTNPEIICSKCHSTNYTAMNSVHGKGVHRNARDGRCGSCHAHVPHGWGRPRLLGSVDDPEPYKTFPGSLRAISLENHSPFTWEEDDCSADCAGDHYDDQPAAWPSDPTWTYPAAIEGNLTGVVTDSTTGDPIAGALISLQSGERDETGSDGRYRIRGVDEATVDLTVEVSGYFMEARTVAVVAGSTTTMDVELDPVPPGPINLAEGRPFYAFKWVRPFNTPSMAGDGSPLTYWRSAEWGDELDRDLLWVDLQGTFSIDRVEIAWADGLWASEFHVYTSTNGVNWRRVYIESGGLAGTSIAAFPAVDARYVRLECRRTGTNRGVGYGVAELRAYSANP